MHGVVYLSLICCLVIPIYMLSPTITSFESAWPSVVISVLVRNKAHTLPYFLSGLHELEYPKSRIHLWFHSDFNEDNSIDILETFVSHGVEYLSVNLTANRNTPYLHDDEISPTHWSAKRFKHVISLKEKALKFARDKQANYIFMLDADVFLTEHRTLKILVEKDMPMVAPMLMTDGLFSNFWGAMTENYYYSRSEDYKLILERKQVGCFDVPMIHMAVLVKLNIEETAHFTFDPKRLKDYDGPVDDIITFALSARKNGIPMYVCNDYIYGYTTVPVEENTELKWDYEQLLNVKLEAISKGTALPLSPFLKEYVVYPKSSKYNSSEIYMINLEKRKERRRLMLESFRELGMEAKIFKAVDGRQYLLNMDFSISLMPEYRDPYHKRPMKAGEIGCFLSHYLIWKEIIDNHHNITLVLEDDIHFAPYFRQRFLGLLKELESYEWDLVYIGRKILLDEEEERVSDNLVKPLYSYWTLAYLLSFNGAMKLVNADPLQNLLPVDEFLPIMFDQHPNDTWKAHFNRRDLIAFSVSPLLVHPTHYTGQPGYISDTEDSEIVSMDETSKDRQEL